MLAAHLGEEDVACLQRHHVFDPSLAVMHVDARTDLSSVAAMAFELLTSRTPFDGEDLPQLINNVRIGQREELRPASCHHVFLVKFAVTNRLMKTASKSDLSVAIVLAGLLVCGCGTGGGVSNTSSCDTPSEGLCHDFPGSAFTPDVVKRGCNGTKDVFSTQPCPAANRVGSCRGGTGQSTEQVLRFYSPMFDDAMAKSGCDMTAGVYTSG
jgi:serine/threonine protein kinase